MAKITLFIFCCGLISIEISGTPIASISNIINLSSLPAEAFISPKRSTGERVKAWRKSETSPNPEELGEYFQGDILFPRGRQRNAIIDSSFRWLGGVIPYMIKGTFSQAELSNISAAIQGFHDNTCIKLVRRKSQKDYIYITSDFTGCWSSVGKKGGPQQLNLQSLGCTGKGTVQHEINHAVGFFHEQSRPDRDDYVTVHLENVDEGMEHNFDKLSSNLVTTLGKPYECGSAMHYSKYAFSANGLPTITPKDPSKILGQRNGLTTLDYEKINAFYGCVRTMFGWISMRPRQNDQIE